jgi:GAF domain-containing protein
MAETLELVCCEAVDALEVVDWAGVTLLLERRPRTFGSTDPRVDEVDRIQYETREGPCLDAMRTYREVQVEDTRTHRSPYGRFAAVASERGIGSVLSLPLLLAGDPVGALNLYAARPEVFDRSVAEAAGLFAAQAAIVVANACAYWDLESLKENMAEAMASRATIEQAKGIIMSTNRCGAERAFELLVLQSQHENVKVRDIAAELVERAQS